MVPSISARARAFPESPIRALAALASQARKRGIKVYHLNIGQPDIPTPAPLLQVLGHYNQNPIAYSPSQGDEPLIEYFRGYYRSIGVELAPENIQVTVGGSEALLFAFLILGEPGDEVVVPEPFYTNYRTIAMQAGLKIVPLETYIEDGFRLPRKEVWAKSIGPRTRALLLCNPSNPTGAVYDRESLEFLANLAREKNLFLIADEVYREFVFDGQPMTSILQLDGMEDRAIVVDSVSKRFSLCGARVGCLVTRNTDVTRSALRLAQARLSAPSLGQAITAAARELPADYFTSVREEYQRRRDVAQRLLSEIPGVICPKPGGAFYSFVQFPVKDIEHFSRWLLTDYTKDHDTTLAMAPGPGFYASPGRGHKEARLAYVLEEGALTHALTILRHALDEYNKRAP